MTEVEIEKKNDWPPIPQIAFALLVIGGLFWYSPSATVTVADEEVIPSQGVTLPVRLGDLGVELVANGVIDKDKFLKLYEGDASLTKAAEKLLSASEGELVITKENAPVVLNFLWALGLANRNPILDSGEMMDPRYGGGSSQATPLGFSGTGYRQENLGAGNFASTGGWTIAKGNAMEHYSRHMLMSLVPEQQALVDKVSGNIYRPCCGNSTHFPDCNHGMAMLGLLELMASQGVSENQMYKAALAVNSYWFPDTYATIAIYMKSKGTEWKDADSKEVLGEDYSSGSGYARIASQVAQIKRGGGGSACAV